MFDATTAVLHPGPYRVRCPAISLMREPICDDATPLHPLRETQVLYGQTLTLLEHQGAYARVCVEGQPRWQGHASEGYIGWVLASALAPVLPTPYLGKVWRRQARVHVLPSRGSEVVATLPPGSLVHGHAVGAGTWIALEHGFLAASCLQPDMEGLPWDLWHGSPYVWGGCLPEGIDCSGLIWTLSHLLGCIVPRDAHDQWCVSILTGCPEPAFGDLLFYRELHESRWSHVALCLEDHQILESARSHGGVRQVALAELWWWTRAGEGKAIRDCRTIPALTHALRAAHALTCPRDSEEEELAPCVAGGSVNLGDTALLDPPLPPSWLRNHPKA